MTNALTATNDVLTMFENKEQLVEIRKLFAPKLNDNEFGMFTGLAKAQGLNPYNREIWAIKYDEKSPAQIFIGRDGYRTMAQRNPDYEYHQADAVYENDEFSVRNGEVMHSYSLKNRGKVVGGYGITKRRSSDKSMYVFVSIEEYNQNRSVWKDKPATMIKKVAEAQVLRMAFQEIFAGTYDESEQWIDENGNKINAPKQNSTANKLKALMKGRNEPLQKPKANVIDVKAENVVQVSDSDRGREDTACDSIDDNANTSKANESLVLDIYALLDEKQITPERKLKALAQFGAIKVEELNEEDARTLIDQLQRISS